MSEQDRPDEAEAVQWFVGQMLAKLRLPENQAKESWLSMSDRDLLFRLSDEVSELLVSIQRGDPDREVIQEAADVANFAMFIADKRRRGGAGGE